MNQRSRNCGRNATMPFGQLVQRRNGRRIAQHHGHGLSFGAAFGFTLRAGLWLGHGSACLRDFRHNDLMRALLGQHVHHVEGGISATGGGHVICDGLEHPAFRRGVRANHAIQVHGYLRGGRVLHESGDRCDVAHEVDHVRQGKPAGNRFNRGNTVLCIRGALNPQQSIANAGTDGRIDLTGGEGGIAQFVHGLHGYLRSGPIPPMCESYTVTSDNATPLDCATQQVTA